MSNSNHTKLVLGVISFGAGLAIDYATGGSATLISTIAKGIGTGLSNIADGHIGDHMQDTLRHRHRFVRADQLNHDIATALSLAFTDAVTELEEVWKADPDYPSDKKTQSSSLKQLQRLREDARHLSKNPAEYAGILKTEEAETVLADRMASTTTLNNMLYAYLWEYPKLLKLTEEKLPDIWLYYFDQILKRQDELGQ